MMSMLLLFMLFADQNSENLIMVIMEMGMTMKILILMLKTTQRGWSEGRRST